MKLRDKATTASILIFLIFSACLYFDLIHSSWINIVLLSAIFFLLLAEITYWMIIKRIETLTAATSQKRPNQVNQADDEIGDIATQINELIQISKQIKRTVEEPPSGGDATYENVIKVKDREILTKVVKFDHLTFLPNRAFFNEVLTKSINYAARRKKILAVLLIDLDGFKKIITRLGPAQATEILQKMGKRFTQVIRSEDVLAKLDEDQFAVLLNDINKAKFAGTVAEKLLKACSRPLKINSHEISLTASIGICIYPNDGLSIEDLMISAQNALYKAKLSGRNNYQFFTHAMSIESQEHSVFHTELRKAIENNELTLHYQPQINLKKGNIVGVEALMRWESPSLGIIPPTRFIPLAEETGLIMQLSEWALAEACQTNKQWQNQGYEHITVALNLSPIQFQHPEIAQIISVILKNTGLDPRYLELEISENIVMENIEYSANTLRKLKEVGVLIAVDHFGTGYTSIRYLKQLPINAIKIDQSFIRGIPTQPNDTAITTALIDLVHHLGLEVIALGVETAEQVQFLADHKCDIVQGYFLSYPLPADKIVLQFKKLQDEVII